MSRIATKIGDGGGENVHGVVAIAWGTLRPLLTFSKYGTIYLI